MLIDTHCHLNFPAFTPDLPAVLERARQAGIKRLLVPGADLPTSRQAVELARRHPEVYAAVGVHPNSVAGFDAQTLRELRELARYHRVVAIGEIGIDLYWQTVPLAEQVAALRAQVQLAAELDLPVLIHDREAHEPVQTVLSELRPPRGGVLHAFSGDQALAEWAQTAGFYLGLGGPLTYKKNAALRAVFTAVPLERILLETDAPYLPPQMQRGQRNEPAYLRAVAEKLAELRQAPLETIAQVTSANAVNLLGQNFVPAVE